MCSLAITASRPSSWQSFASAVDSVDSARKFQGSMRTARLVKDDVSSFGIGWMDWGLGVSVRVECSLPRVTAAWT